MENCGWKWELLSPKNMELDVAGWKRYFFVCLNVARECWTGWSVAGDPPTAFRCHIRRVDRLQTADDGDAPLAMSVRGVISI